MKNFFNAISVADMERIHSSMIAWIIDDANDAALSGKLGGSKFHTFPLNVRSKLLCMWFGVDPTRQFKTIKAKVEWNNIDVMIESEDSQGKKDVWIIENKLKSQEHQSNDKKGGKIWQTQKYEDIITDRFKGVPAHFILLSLMGDKAKSNSMNWKSYTYEDLYKSLQQELPSSMSYSLIYEYVNAIGKMTQNLTTFLNSDYQYCDYVFKKQNIGHKVAKKPTEQYIVGNGLETIFQKCFLKHIIKNITSQTLTDYGIAETHGTALLEYTYKTKGMLHLGVQFQNGAFKAQVLDKDSTKSHIDFWTKWNHIIPCLKKKYPNWKYNPSKGNKEKYFSFSLLVKDWYKKPFNCIIKDWDNGFKSCEMLLDTLSNIISNKKIP